MARFVADDAVEKLIEDWVTVLLREAAVRLNGRALVHGTPRHVQSEEILPRGRHHLRDSTVDAIHPRRARADARRDGMPRAIEELRERASMHAFFVEPADQKRTDVRVFERAPGEDRSRKDDGVTIDVQHVADALEDVGCKRIVADRAP